MPVHKRYCSVCSNYGGKLVGNRKASMHRFPANKRVMRIWIARCKNARPNFVYANNDQTRLCGDHFIGKQGPSKEHTLPVFFPRPDGSEKIYKLSKLDDSDDKLYLSVFEDNDMDTEQVPDEQHISTDSDNDMDCNDFGADGLVADSDDTNLDISLKLHDYEGVVPTVGRTQHKAIQTTVVYRSIATQTDESSIIHISDVSTQTTVTTSVNFGLQVKRPSLTFNDISDDDSKVLFYTGITDAGTFNCLFNELEGGMTRDGESGRPRILRLVDEFFLVLMRLRLGLLLEDLADRFYISTSTCSNIFNKWIDYMDANLQFLVKWPSRQNIDYTMPEQFKRKYPKCRVVIDCTEIRTETPCSLQMKSLLYSDYKSHMTYKSLIGISPAGIVTFVSDLYSGSVSDKQITKLTGLVDLCEEGDAIMVDKGFLISDLTTPKGIDLIIPPFKQKKRQFLPYEVEATKNIANLRIHVEREMERIKNFRIVQGTMPITMAAQSTKIWKTCVRLTNLQPPLVLNN